MGLNVNKIREDFPLLSQSLKGKPIVYFDNACMTMKPRQVIDAVVRYYSEYPACGGRSMHKLGKKVTEEVELARKQIAKFINAKSEKEIVFTKNTTEAINLVANSLSFKEGDIVVTSDKEHNSNLLQWQMLKGKGVKHKWFTTDFFNGFDERYFMEVMSKKVRLVSVGHTSNLDGVTLPAEKIIKIAHDYGALVLLDCAQSVPHKSVDVRKLDADFIAFSGHKMLGPTGTGVLYGKYDLLDELSPFMIGGDTVMDSTYESCTLEKPPEKFEAGLQHYAGIIGFGEAVKYLTRIGMANIEEHEIRLNKKITEELLKVDRIKLIGPEDASLRSGIFSFNIEGVDSHNVAIMLDSSANIMIRSGAHCVHSWFNAHNLKGSARASFYLYNTELEADLFIDEVKKIVKYIK